MNESQIRVCIKCGMKKTPDCFEPNFLHCKQCVEDSAKEYKRQFEIYKIGVQQQKHFAEDEIKQINLELHDTRELLKGVQAKLGNEGFIVNAPQAVLEDQKTKLFIYTETIARIERILNAIQNV